MALLGGSIPDAYQTLIYVVVIGAMVIYAAITLFQLRAAKMGAEPGSTPVNEPELKPEPAPIPQSELEPATPVTPIDALQAREKYLRAVADDCRSLRLGGLSTDAADPNQRPMRLEKVYRSLDTTTQIEAEERKKRGKSDFPAVPGTEARPLSALEALSTNKDRCIVLLGYPGRRASPLLPRFLALAMAELEQDRSQVVQERLETWKARAPCCR